MFQLFVVREGCSSFWVVSRCRYWTFQLESHFAEGWLLNWWMAPLPPNVQLLWVDIDPETGSFAPSSANNFSTQSLRSPVFAVQRARTLLRDWQPLDRSTSPWSKEAAELALTPQRCGAPRRIRRGQIRLRVRDERCRDLGERVLPRGRQPGHFLCENAQCQACAAWRALQSDPLDPQRQHQRRCKSHKQGIQVPMQPTNRLLNMQKNSGSQIP